MACSGPSKEFAFEQGEKAFEDLLILLKEQYQVERPHVMKGTLHGKQVELGLGRKMQEDWDKQSEQLKLLIQEIVWTSDAASW
jgi:hypothetical protein